MSATTFKFTRPIVTKINRLLDAGLIGGLGKPEAGKGCVEAIICLALGLQCGKDRAGNSKPQLQEGK